MCFFSNAIFVLVCVLVSKLRCRPYVLWRFSALCKHRHFISANKFFTAVKKCLILPRGFLSVCRSVLVIGLEPACYIGFTHTLCSTVPRVLLIELARVAPRGNKKTRKRREFIELAH